MVPVTQLYVSVDASTKDSLKKIDRPLFSDFWERFILSLQHLKNKVPTLFNTHAHTHTHTDTCTPVRTHTDTHTHTNA